ncbi:MerC domain-containing protein [Candidatus Bealeia paramacronuclearis]|uniref:MerC domain-containing protein n=1 Tax=Candidatus Bealeia paramacronuclearis TaxID=1921001 RepID=A0ABZ2C4M3_9PROT|nr:MerC domain-containing protein [Candidatus Bealeia paramacronuclearis]
MEFDSKKWLETLSGVGAVILSLLTCAACPLCIPVYTGALGLLGFEICRDDVFLFPFIGALFLITLGLMAYHSFRHKKAYLPLGVAIVVSILAAVCLWYDWDYQLYASLGLFSLSLFWHKRALRQCGHEGDHDHQH